MLQQLCSYQGMRSMFGIANSICVRTHVSLKCRSNLPGWSQHQCCYKQQMIRIRAGSEVVSHSLVNTPGFSYYNRSPSCLGTWTHLSTLCTTNTHTTPITIGHMHTQTPISITRTHTHTNAPYWLHYTYKHQIHVHIQTSLSDTHTNTIGHTCVHTHTQTPLSGIIIELNWNHVVDHRHCFLMYT